MEEHPQMYRGMTRNPLGGEKRALPRMSTQASVVKIYGECQRTYGYVRDISRTGMQIRTFMFCSPVPKKPGENINIEFSIAECGLAVGCTAQVVWNMVPEQGPPTMNFQGVRFVDIDEGLRERLDGCVRERLDS